MNAKHSSLMDEISKAQDTLRSLFDEIGLARCDREGRETSLFTALNVALHEQLKSVVTYVSCAVSPTCAQSLMVGRAQ
jgi:Ase1/PRC1/MAP65 family protein